MNDQEGDELLLPCTRGPAREAAVGEYAKASEQLEAQTGSGRHSSSLPSLGQNHEGRFAAGREAHGGFFNAEIAEIAGVATGVARPKAGPTDRAGWRSQALSDCCKACDRRTRSINAALSAAHPWPLFHQMRRLCDPCDPSVNGFSWTS